MGNVAAKQNAESLLRRAVMTCLLWENITYESGSSVAENIKNLIPQVDPSIVFQIAVDARNIQKLRHAPLYIAAVMAGLSTHKSYVSTLLPKIVVRADELAEFVSIYWKLNGHKVPLSAQIKKGLSAAFVNFNEYGFAKYRGEGNEIKLRDVVALVHPLPENEDHSNLYKAILDNTLATPDTWEVALSTGKDKKETWERLIQERKLGALAFMRNLRNMEESKVDFKVIEQGFETINPKWLLPLNFLSAAKYAPRWESKIEELMIESLSLTQKLPGKTIFVVDVSGSMGTTISGKSEFTRMDVAEAMAMFAASVCENITIYATAGSDGQSKHSTKLIPSRKGFGMMESIKNAVPTLGGGGIFVRQCLEYIKEKEHGEIPERIIIFSDSQDCDRYNKVPSPFGKYNYIVDVSANSHGVNYDGLWTAEVSGWSEHFIPYIMAMEGINLQEQDE
jgi:hypothetical protein